MARKTRSSRRGYSRPRVSARRSVAPRRGGNRARAPRRGGGSATVRLVIEQPTQTAAILNDPRVIPMTPGRARF